MSLKPITLQIALAAMCASTANANEQEPVQAAIDKIAKSLPPSKNRLINFIGATSKPLELVLQARASPGTDEFLVTQQFAAADWAKKYCSDKMARELMDLHGVRITLMLERKSGSVISQLAIDKTSCITPVSNNRSNTNQNVLMSSDKHVEQVSDVNPISKSEWLDLLQGRNIDEKVTYDISAQLKEMITKSIKLGDRRTELRKTLMVVVLNRYFSERNHEKGTTVWSRNSQTLDDLQRILTDSGISADTLAESARELEMVLPNNPPAKSVAGGKSLARSGNTKKGEIPRPASVIGRQSIIEAVSQDLKDPSSARYGEITVFNGRACATVNAKNSFGGYTGNQQAMALYSKESSRWISVLIQGVSHSSCILTFILSDIDR